MYTRKFYDNIPVIKSVHLLPGSIEYLVTCKCGAMARLYITSREDIYDELRKLSCRNCDLPSSEYFSLAHHSGDLFNSIEMRRF